MTTEAKEILDTVERIRENVKAAHSSVEENHKQFEERLTELEKRQNRPGAAGVGGAGSSKRDPELSAYLAKGAQPAFERKELSVTSDGQGVTVRSEWSDRIFREIIETSPMRDVASVMQTNSNELEVLVDRDEPASDWIGELDARSKTDASFLTRQTIPVHEHYANPEITLQMLDDDQLDVEQWLQGKLIRRFGRQEAAAFINGDGTGKPRGILDYEIESDANFAWAADPANYTIGAIYTGVDGDIDDADPLFDQVDALKVAYLPRASWLMTRAFRNKVRKLKDGQDNYLLEPSLAAGTPDRLLGYPVRLAEDMPALEADAVGALFGDFSEAYSIVDRVGLTVQRDPYTKPGWVKYYTRRRVGGALTNPEAVKALVLGVDPATT